MSATLPARCGNCPNPADCSPTFCDFNDSDGVYDRAYTKAAEKHFAQDYGNPGFSHTMLEKPLHLRAWDWVGNIPHKLSKFAKELGFNNIPEMLVVAVLLVGGCAMVAPLLVGWLMPK